MYFGAYFKGSKSPQSSFEGFFALAAFHGWARVDGARIEFIDNDAGASGVEGTEFGTIGDIDML